MKTMIKMLAVFMLHMIMAVPDGHAIGVSSPDGDDIYLVVDEMPIFPGGDEALRNFIANNIRYSENDKSGRVFVYFVVEKDGRIERASIARSVDPVLDAEALRVVKLMPKWKPGKNKGKPVRVSYTIPINFSKK